MRSFLSYAVLLLLFLAAACRKDVIWSETINLNPEGWDPQSPAIFEIDKAPYYLHHKNNIKESTARAIGDTLQSMQGIFKASLSLRYTDKCTTSDLRLVIEHASLDNPVSTDTITLTLFNPDGTPAGSGHYGIYEVIHPVSDHLIVDQGCIISVVPLNYNVNPAGIESATLILH